MTSELSFLIELLLKHKLPTATRDLIAGRIKDVEASYSNVSQASVPSGAPATPLARMQCASTRAILDRNPDLNPPAPVAVIAHTPAAQAALASRESAIKQAVSDIPEKGRTSPRKF